MADGVSFSLTGVDELIKTLNGVTYDTKRKGGRFALRKAAQVIRDKAKQNADRIDEEATGRKISDNIAERWDGKRFKRTGDPAFRVGVLGGNIKQADKGNPDTGAGGATPHAMLAELGTEHSAPQSFLRAAATSEMGKVVDTFALQYSKSLDRAIKLHKKKGTVA